MKYECRKILYYYESFIELFHLNIEKGQLFYFPLKLISDIVIVYHLARKLSILLISPANSSLIEFIYSLLVP